MYLEFKAKTHGTGSYMLSIIDPVRKPTKRIAPKPVLMTAIGAVSGIIGALFCVLVFAPGTTRPPDRIASDKES
jgi:hypothetical protein